MDYNFVDFHVIYVRPPASASPKRKSVPYAFRHFPQLYITGDH
jgi:hypothetical protein